LLTLGILSAASIGCFLLRDLLHTDNYISMVYTFAVFLIARFTKSVLLRRRRFRDQHFAINYVFTFPYFAFNFTLRAIC
jgi:two-component system sensor histidine kinase KdpD